MGILSGPDDSVMLNYCLVVNRAPIGFHERFQFAVSDVVEADLGVPHDILGEMHFPVFVPVRETIEDEESIPGIPSLVRLKLLNDCDIVGVHPRCHSLPSFKCSLAGVLGKGIV